MLPHLITALIILSSGIAALAVPEPVTVTAPREFRIDYEQDQFLLDGEPFRYVSGSLHYFRLPRVFWRDRLRKFRYAGLNVVSTYVEWSQHEPSPGHYDFEGDLDLKYFVKLAWEEGLLVILRPGPYICAERDMGGLPAWLLTAEPEVNLRTNDSRYLTHVDNWLNKLMPMMHSQLYGNGGPIIMVQVENEYGSYPACDRDYTGWLRDRFQQHVGTAALLFTTDGGAEYFLKCGKIEGVYATVDFGTGTNVTSAFAAQRMYEPHGPLVNSEFYPGWLTHWEEKYQKVSTSSIVKTLETMLAVNASVNFYMFFGGTNFGFTAGANYGPDYNPQLTSYDYDAPLTEAGDLTDKYTAIRDVIGKFLPLPDIPLPVPTEKGDYGMLTLLPVVDLFDSKARQGLGSAVVSHRYPLSFEQLGQRYGFVLYETQVPKGLTDPDLLTVSGVRDRANVYVDRVKAGVLSRKENIESLPLQAQEGQMLQILVENQGRINYGPELNDFKGIVSNVTLGDGRILQDWTITGFPLSDDAWLNDQTSNSSGAFNLPTLFRGSFQLPRDEAPLDTFLHTGGWGKGVAYLNGYNLGRYWPAAGPQITLYVPSSFLLPHPAHNNITLLELEMVPSTHQVAFVTEPELDTRPL